MAETENVVGPADRCHPTIFQIQAIIEQACGSVENSLGLGTGQTDGLGEFQRSLVMDTSRKGPIAFWLPSIVFQHDCHSVSMNWVVLIEVANIILRSCGW